MDKFNLAWGARVSPTFRLKLIEICRGFGWSPNHASWLMACMAFETGETFSTRVKNLAGSGAVGLIQFMPKTANGLGTTTEALYAMNYLQQLDYVRLYFKPYAHRINTLSDMYMAILMPKFIGQPDDAVLFQEGAAYRQNAGLDKNKDGKITKLEATNKVIQALSRGASFSSEELVF